MIGENMIRLSIKARIMVFFMVGFAICIVLLTLISNSIAKRIILEKASQDIEHDTALVETNLEHLLIEADSCANAAIININSFIGFDEVDVDDLQDFQATTFNLKRAEVLFERISHVFFFTNDGRYISTASFKNFYPYGDISGTPLFAQIEGTRVQPGWLFIERDSVLSINNERKFLTYSKSLRNIESSKEIGYVVLNVGEDQVFDIYKDLIYAEGIVYRIIDGNRRIVSSSERNEVHQIMKADTFIYDSDLYITKTLEIKGTDWQIMSTTPISVLTDEVDEMSRTMALIGLSIMAIGILMAIQLSRVIANPITDLSQHMKTLKDKRLTPYEDNRRQDEIGSLIRSFNGMIERNDKLRSAMEEKEKKKRYFELALLQSQIKPHFLYNTLDIINRLAALGKHEEVISATKNIANFYRISLSKGDEIIAISRELELVEKYLKIQKIRYPEVFEWVFDVEPSINEFMIPKMTLQPLVENAIYHGLKSLRRKGTITVTGSKVGDWVTLSVKDDGCGMDGVKAEEVLYRSEALSLDKPYGVLSIKERLALQFQERCKLDIKSAIGEGFEVTIRIKDVEGRLQDD